MAGICGELSERAD